MDSGLREYPEIVKEYFATVIPAADNKFAALNSAVWSGGSFIYVPKGVHVEMPLQAYFRINAQNMGQFERTLIIADEDSRVHYIEGCTAPHLFVGLAAFGSGRTDRQTWCAYSLYDHSELVEQRLQPGHQARSRLRRRHCGVGGRKSGLESDDQVSGGLPARPRVASGDPVPMEYAVELNRLLALQMEGSIG